MTVSDSTISRMGDATKSPSVVWLRDDPNDWHLLPTRPNRAGWMRWEPGEASALARLVD